MFRRTRGLSLAAAAALFGGVAIASTAAATTAPPATEAPNPLEGTTVTVFGVETAVEGPAFQVALNEFADANAMTVTYSGSRGFEGELGTMIEGGSPPDIAVIPQPGRIAGYAASGDAMPLPEDVAATAAANIPESVLSRYVVDDALYGVPFKADLKSLVWYLPAVFAEKGYEVPTTWDDFLALTETMIANGDTPLCVGIGSQDATGWPFTDWTEEIVLREQGLDFYNQWVAHEVPFNSPEIVSAMQQVIDLWNTEGMVYAEGGDIASTDFRNNGTPLVEGDCLMHRQANFYTAFFPEGTEYGDGPGQVNAFYFPANEGQPTLTGGNTATAFRDAPEVWAVMNYLATPEFANARQKAQAALSGGGITGFLTATAGVDTSLWTPLEQTFIGILQSADPAGFDASDQMPTEVNAAFWSQGTSLVNGDITAQEAADAIEATWPAG
jgi:alpha-glucoside transport system substrate-binding protein